MSLYMDGERLHEKYYGDIEVNNSDQALKVGANFDGMIDEIRISDCARYADTVYIVPNDPFSNDECTRGLWHFDDPLESMECHDCCKEDNCLFLFKGAFVTSSKLMENPVGLNSKLKIFPNPTSGKLNIELINLKLHYTFELINIAGQVVVKKEFRSTVEQIDLRGLAKGIYLLKVYNPNFSKTEKLIIQ